MGDTYQSKEEMKVRVSPGSEAIYPPHPVSNHEVLRNPDTYTEDGPNGSSFDGRPDQPLNDRVGLWKDRLFGSTTLKTAISRGATRIADIRPCFDIHRRTGSLWSG